MVKSGESWRFDAIRGLKNIVVVVVGLCLETNVDLILCGWLRVSSAM